MFSHTYQSPGKFRARLTVQDSYGLESNNAAEVVLEVAEPQIVTRIDASDSAIEYKKGWHSRDDAAASNGWDRPKIGVIIGRPRPNNIYLSDPEY